MPRPKRKTHAAVGFTVIEVVAVLLVIGIISGVILTRSYFNVNLPSESDVLRAYLRYAQLRSMNTDSVWYVRFFDDGDVYGLFRDGNPAAMPGEQHTTQRLSRGISAHVQPEEATIFAFDTYGRPCTDPAAAILQEGGRQIVLTHGTDSQTISVTDNTGYIP